MNFIKHLNFIFLILVLIFSSCHDDNMPIVENTPCTENAGELVQNYDSTIVITCPIMSDYIPLNQYDYKEPVFNPTNPDEIIYIRIDNTGGDREVWKYNFCTNETTFITNEASFGLDWSSKDWVVFVGAGNDLFKIKSNGDSLVQLTDNDNFYHDSAKWNEEGTAYLAETFQPQELVISDENGNVLSVTPSNIGFISRSWNWNHGRIFYSSTDNDASMTYYGEFRQETGEFQELGAFSIEENSRNVISNINYNILSNSLYWNNSYHISKHNLDNSDAEYLTNGFDNRHYLNFDVSSTEDAIITSRSNLRQIDGCTIEGEIALYLIDVTGEQERRISIPE